MSSGKSIFSSLQTRDNCMSFGASLPSAPLNQWQLDSLADLSTAQVHGPQGCP